MRWLCVQYANKKREYEGNIQLKCPFCRKAAPQTEEENDDLTMKRIEANDPVAICNWGTKLYEEGDYKSAFEYWKRAIALGDLAAHYQLSHLSDWERGRR